MNADLNSMLKEVGGFGPYQVYLCIFLVTPSAFVTALLYFTQLFIILVPPHHCSIGLNTETEVKSYIPLESRNGKPVHSSCYMYVESRPGNQSNSRSNHSQIKCPNGWYYDYSSLYPSMATESDWVCDRDRQPYVAQTIFFAGTSIGCIVFGYVSDKFGRKPSIIISSLIACAAGIASAFAFDFWSFSALRFLVGMAIIPLSEDPFVLSLEYLSVEKRTIATVSWTVGYITASVLCPWIAYLLKSWRVLCVITSCPLLLALIGIKLIPESASWLFTQGRTDEALTILRNVAKVNKRPICDQLNRCQYLLTDSVVNDMKSTAQELTIVDILRAKRMRRRLILLSICWFILFVCYHTNTHNSSNVGSDVYISFTFGALIEIPATIFVYLSLDRFGRRWPMCGSMLVSGVAGLSTLVLSGNQLPRDLYLIITLVMRVCLAIEYNTLMQYSTEVFPTVLRGRSLAFLRVIGTLGLYVSPSIVYLSTEAESLPLVITGLMSIICALFTVFLAETMHHNLPHTLEEGEHFGQDQTICSVHCLY